MGEECPKCGMLAVSLDRGRERCHLLRCDFERGLPAEDQKLLNVISALSSFAEAGLWRYRSDIYFMTLLDATNEFLADYVWCTDTNLWREKI